MLFDIANMSLPNTHFLGELRAILNAIPVERAKVRRALTQLLQTYRDPISEGKRPKFARLRACLLDEDPFKQRLARLAISIRVLETRASYKARQLGGLIASVPPNNKDFFNARYMMQALWQAIAALEAPLLQLTGKPLSSKTWKTFCEGLAKSQINHLDLSDLDLHSLSAPDWKLFCNALSEINLAMLDLRGTGLFDRLNIQEWQLFFTAIAKNTRDAQKPFILIPGNAGQSEWDSFCLELAKSSTAHLNLMHPNIRIDFWKSFWNIMAKEKQTTHLLTSASLEKYAPTAWKEFCSRLSKTTEPLFSVTDLNFAVLTYDQLQIFWNAINQSQIKCLSLGNSVTELNDSDYQVFWLNLAKSKLRKVELTPTGLIAHYRENEKKWEIFCKGFATSNFEELDLTNFNLDKISEKSWEIFCVALSKSKITNLNLAQTNLNKLSEQQWFMFCNALAQSSIEHLSLAKNDLTQLSQRRYQAFYLAIATSKLKTLDLSGNNFFAYMLKGNWVLLCSILQKSSLNCVFTGDDNSVPLTLAELLSCADGFDVSKRTSIKHQNWQKLQLKLSESKWNLEPSQKILMAFEMYQIIPEGILKDEFECLAAEFKNNDNDFRLAIKLKLTEFTEIDLNKLHIINDWDLHQIINNEYMWRSFCEMISSTKIEKFKFEGKKLFRLPLSQWHSLAQAIAKSNIKSLDLSCNGFDTSLFWSTPDYWMDCCTLICSKLVELNLESNYLFANNNKDWRIFWDAVCASSSLKKLSIRSCLGRRDSSDWHVVCDAIIRCRLDKLNFSLNYLSERPDADWDLFCKAIEQTNLKRIALGQNGFHELSLGKWSQLLNALSNSNIKKTSWIYSHFSKFPRGAWDAFCRFIETAEKDGFSLGHNELCELGEERTIKLCKAIQASNLKFLDVSHTLPMTNGKTIVFNWSLLFELVLCSGITEIKINSLGSVGRGFWLLLKESQSNMTTVHLSDSWVWTKDYSNDVASVLECHENFLSIAELSHDAPSEIRLLSQYNQQFRAINAELFAVSQASNTNEQPNLQSLNEHVERVLQKLKELAELPDNSAHKAVARRLQKRIEMLLTILLNQHGILVFELLEALPLFTPERASLYDDYFHSVLVNQPNRAVTSAAERLLEAIPHCRNLLNQQLPLSTLTQPLFDTVLQSAVVNRVEPGQQNLTLEERVNLLLYFIAQQQGIHLNRDFLMLLEQPMTPARKNSLTLFWNNSTSKRIVAPQINEAWEYCQQLNPS